MKLAAIRKLLVDILKNLNKNSSSPIPLVIVKNTGIVPRKLVKVKKEVKHSYAKGNSVSIKV